MISKSAIEKAIAMQDGVAIPDLKATEIPVPQRFTLEPNQPARWVEIAKLAFFTDAIIEQLEQIVSGQRAFVYIQNGAVGIIVLV
jgi:hypothetical protein